MGLSPKESESEMQSVKVIDNKTYRFPTLRLANKYLKYTRNVKGQLRFDDNIVKIVCERFIISA